MLPKTYLMTAPKEVAQNPFGETLLSDDLIRGLRRCNPNIVMPLPDHYTGWYPGKDRENPVDSKKGATCIWLGQPCKGDGCPCLKGGACTGRKITGTTLGAIPEWTQIHPDGTVLAVGWRHIFEKVVKAGATSKARLEQEFKIVLDVGPPEQGVCPVCRRVGKQTKGYGKLNLCRRHDVMRRVMRLPG